MLKKGIILPALMFLLAVLMESAIHPVSAEEFPTLYRGIRPLGMGGAFITLSDDENAMFYNPAGLNDINGFGGVGLLNPIVEVSQNSIDFYKDFKDIDTENEVEVSEFLKKQVGEPQHLRVAALPHLVIHNFAIGGLGQATMDLEVRNPANPEVVADVKIDVGVLISGALGFFDRKLQVGVTGKYIQRDGILTTYTARRIAEEDFDPLDEDRQKEKDFAFDLGVKYNPALFLKPTFAVVLQNITDLDFEELGKLPQQLNIGAAINPDFGFLKTTFAVQIDDVTKEVETDDDLYKRTHFGAEFRFPMIISLRAGLNQGYVTAGATVDLWIFAISYATYAEELGAFSGQRADRRHILQASLGF